MARPVGWVMTVAVNVERSRHKRDEQIRAATARAAEPKREQGEPESAFDLERALAQLTDRQRTAVILRFYAQLNTKETATAMRCAEGTVKATLHAALAHLRIEISEREEQQS
jgi:RNA polymerase sigma-70 factor, ECF subfamily